jgi:hypothetical protein
LGYLFEIYHLFELNNPIFTFDFRNLAGIDLINYQIINCFIYEKLFLLILKNDSSENFIIKAFSPSFYTGKIFKNLNLERGGKSDFIEGRIWCNQNYSLLNDYVLFTKEINSRKLSKILYSNNLINFSKNKSSFPMIDNLAGSSEKSNSVDKNNMKILKKFKDKIKFYKNDKNLSKNTNVVIFYILTENSLNWFEFKSSVLNYSNSNKFKNNANSNLNFNSNNISTIKNTPSSNQDFLFNQLTTIKDTNIYNYTFLRKFELLNYCLRDKLFENIEEILDKINNKDKYRGFILKLLWSYIWKNEYNSKIKDIVERYILEDHLSETNYLASSEYFRFLIGKFIEFLIFNLVEKSKINLENFFLLVYLYNILSELNSNKSKIDVTRLKEMINSFKENKKVIKFLNYFLDVRFF